MSLPSPNDEPDQNEPAPQRPSSSEIRSELVALRTDLGVSVGKIADKAPGLMRLPVTETQRKFQGWAESDRHIAAYEALGCVIDTWQNLIDQAILTVTLRYRRQGRSIGVGLVSAWNQPTLTTRQELLWEIIGYQRRHGEHLRDQAYQALAEELVMLHSSPCVAAVPPEPGERAASEERYTIRELMAAFAVIGEIAVQERVAKEALKRLSQIRSQSETPGQSIRASSLEELANVFRKRIYGEYAVVYEEKKGVLFRTHGFRKVHEGFITPDIVSPKALERILPDGSDLDIIDRLTANGLEREDDVTTSDHRDETPRLGIHTERIGRSVQLLLELVMEPGLVRTQVVD